MRRLALSFALALAACSQAPGDGEARRHPTIVSLNPCSDAVLTEVADPGQILAISHYSRDPASSSMDLEKAERYPAVSGSVEEVLALRPDLVVADEYLPALSRAAMREAGLNLVELPIVTSVADGKAQVQRLARLVGHPERGEALNARIDAALEQAAPRQDREPVTAVVWQAGGVVPGDGTLIADLLRHTGFVNFSAARGLGQADFLPLEQMLADPPQVILAAGNPRGNEDRLLSHPALDSLATTRRERLDPSLLWCGGPTIIRAAQSLSAVRGSP